MDNTTLTIIGMIAAFLTASITPVLTESVKNAIQHKTKLRNLRIALYKEIWNNLRSITGVFFRSDIPFNPKQTVEYLGNRALRTECYNHVLQNDVTLFYELKDADAINMLQGNCIGEMKSIPGSGMDVDDGTLTFQRLTKAYQALVLFEIDSGSLDKKIFHSFVTKAEYEAMMEMIAADWKGREEEAKTSKRFARRK